MKSSWVEQLFNRDAGWVWIVFLSRQANASHGRRATGGRRRRLRRWMLARIAHVTSTGYGTDLKHSVSLEVNLLERISFDANLRLLWLVYEYFLFWILDRNRMALSVSIYVTFASLFASKHFQLLCWISPGIVFFFPVPRLPVGNIIHALPRRDRDTKTNDCRNDAKSISGVVAVLNSTHRRVHPWNKIPRGENRCRISSELHRIRRREKWMRCLKHLQIL